MLSPLPPVLPVELRREADRLFDTTLWCVGRDVVCPEGNLLLRRGFTRERLPEGQQGSSVYTLTLPEAGVLTLWGFGVLVGRGPEEAIFISRDGFTPRLVDATRVAWPVFQAAGLGPLREPGSPGERRAARAAVVTLAEWFAEHEVWVGKVMGLTWRSACLAERRKAPPVSAEALATAWWRLAVRVRALDLVVNDFTAPAVGA